MDYVRLEGGTSLKEEFDSLCDEIGDQIDREYEEQKDLSLGFWSSWSSGS